MRGVEEDEVGLLAGFERADLVIPQKRLRAVDRRHAQRLPRADRIGIDPGILEQASDDEHLAHQVEVAGGRYAVGAQPDRDAGLHQLGIFSDRRRALAELE